ncbi:MAG: GGDEF domain-containing protein [Acidobacteriia bacterium]|nr:GGDEF domain-containing protein [Terriglobia bacterium]
MTKAGISMTNDSRSQDTFSAVTQQLAALEKRDWELWIIVCVAGVLIAVGFLALIAPAAFMKQDEVHLQIAVSRQLVVSLFVLLILLNTYLVTRRLDLRRTRQKLISSTIQNELVRLQSFTDPLTEVYNRRSLDDMAGRFISHARRLQNPLTFMLIDVDRFKEVNTRFGHLTGDFVLAEVATLLRSSVRGSDAVVRYGGDEFLIILADTGDLGARQVVRRIRKYLLDWNKSGHLDRFELNLSIGISEWTDGSTLDEMLDTADRAMYAEKTSRKPGLSTLSPMESNQ